MAVDNSSVKPNIEKLTSYINSQSNPTEFMKVLLIALFKPSLDSFPDRKQKL